MFIPFVKPILRFGFRILSFILFAVTLLAAYSGRVNPAFSFISSTAAGLITLLPYFVFATLAVTILWLCFKRFIMAGFGVLTLFLAWGPISTVMPMHSSSKPTPGAVTFKVLTYNILHGDDQEKGNEAPGNRSFEYVINSGADIVCLQELVDLEDPNEVHNLDSFRDSLKKVYPYQVGLTVNDQKVLSKYPVKFISYHNFFPAYYDAARYSAYEVDIKGHKLTLINFHLNSYALSDKERTMLSDMASITKMEEGVAKFKETMTNNVPVQLVLRKKHTESLREAIDRVKGPLLMCGDFNDVPESYVYRLLRGTDVKDAYVDTSFGPMVTYNRHAFWFHLDQIFYRGDLKPLWVKKGHIRSSDHYPLLAEFEFTPAS